MKAVVFFASQLFLLIAFYRELIKKFKATTLTRYDVHEAIISLLTWGLRWTPTKDTPTCQLLTGTFNLEIQEAIKEQTNIRWCNVRRGFISARWAKAQTLFAQTDGQRQTGWTKLLTTQVLNVSWEMWKQRNKALHGDNRKELRENTKYS